EVERNVSIKLTMLGLEIAEDFCEENVASVLEAAASVNGFVRIDMEGSKHTQRTLDLFRRLRARYDNVGIVLQAYLHRTPADHKVPADRFEFQMLYGLRPRRWDELVAAGHRVRIYVPYGTHWFPYFYRRLRERKENVWFVLRSLLGG